MSVAVGGISGVEKVNVSLNKGLVSIALKPGNKVSMAQIRKAVLKNAFTPKEATVSAIGEVLMSAGQPRLKLAETGEVYALRAAGGSNRVLAALRKDVGKTVLVEGVIPASKGKEQSELDVTSVREVEVSAKRSL